MLRKLLVLLLQPEIRAEPGAHRGDSGRLGGRGWSRTPVLRPGDSTDSLSSQARHRDELAKGEYEIEQSNQPLQTLRFREEM